MDASEELTAVPFEDSLGEEDFANLESVELLQLIDDILFFKSSKACAKLISSSKFTFGNLLLVPSGFFCDEYASRNP